MMKNLYPILLLALTTFSKAQSGSIALFHHKTSVAVVPNATIYVSTSPGPDSISKKTIDIQNLSTTNSYTYNVKRYDMVTHSVSALDYAKPNFCFATLCYGTITMLGSTELELQPLQNSVDLGADTAFYSLDADLIDASTIGYSVVKYTVFNVNNVNDSIQFTMCYNLNLKGAGITENGRDVSNKMNVFPNPCASETTIHFTSTESTSAEIRMLSSNGQVLFREQSALLIGDNALKIQLEAYPAGIYYVLLSTPEGSATKKVVIVH